MRKQRRDIAGILVIGKSTAANFADQPSSLEKLVSALERNRA
jgi:hypothetical protein